MRVLCEERKISLAKLERMADIGNGSIDGWDDHEPRLGTLDKVSRALKMPLIDLIDYLCVSVSYTGRSGRVRRSVNN